jgi:hypothetical protein
MMWVIRGGTLLVLWVLMLLLATQLVVWAQETTEKTEFKVKYIAEGVVYLEGGHAAGLKEGQNLIIEHAVAKPAADSQAPGTNLSPPLGVIATLKVISVAEASAVCEIKSSSEPVQVGDIAKLAPEVIEAEQAEQQKERLAGGREYPQLITFSGSADPVVEEARAAVPRPPSPEINRMRGRIGFEYDTILTRDNPSSTSTEVGLVARFDMTRIGGTYWNFNGYYRGRFSTISGNAAPVTISDLENRTYTLNLQYNNPNSRLVMGVGRLYLPWASSLDIMDGGYIGRKVGDRTTLGVFGGSTPDPASYDYNPNGKVGGAFLNFSGGSFEDWRYSVTFGVALAAIGWHASRQFGFDEISISLKHNLFLYDATEVDVSHAVVVTPTSTTGMPPPTTTTGTGGLNRSYVSLRYQPDSHVEFELNDTFYRNFPSFDPSLISTGLLDQYLFQGLSGGVRVNLPARISVYTDIGKSSATGDASSSWNQLYGLSLGELGHTGIHADIHYSRFNSSFGSGDYKVISLSRQLSDRLNWQFQAGLQNFNSPLTTTTNAHFINTYLDLAVGKQMFFQTGYTWQRGGTMNYDQFEFVVGKRF